MALLIRFLIPILILLALPHGARAASIDGVRFGQHPDKIRIVIDMKQARNIPDFRAFTVEKPPRIILDLPATAWDVRQVESKPAFGMTDVRHGALGGGLSRVVFEMAGPVAIQGAFAIPERDGQPMRLVIDYVRTNAAGASKAATQMHGTMTATATAASLPAQPSARSAPSPAAPKSLGTLTIRQAPIAQAQAAPVPPMAIEQIQDAAPVRPPGRRNNMTTKIEKPLIIIDPGHGGEDPGARGANGVHEKAVTLAVGKKLRDLLEQSGQYRVRMTRDTDVFIPLRDRVRLARRHGGDLFISLHADSISQSAVRGASVYTLSEKASDAETAKLAARENSADLIAGVDLRGQDDDVANILIDLATRDTMNQSKFLANTVIAKLSRNNVRTLPERPHRSAGFVVLKAPDIPSVLVEMGYMTNMAEVSALTSASYQKQIAGALKNSVDLYFDKVASYQTSGN